MDDFEVTNLHESKNEWVARLVNVLTPLIQQGIKSIFDESWRLCEENEEIEKYLMTFQNLLSRVPKWNDTIIEKEVQRIISTSGCSYLNDLITCVHIIQLKILTSIRVGKKQKKVDIAIPKLNEFIHNVYIQVSRKLYTNVYLFEKNIRPLQFQKNQRETEIIVRECILNTVRENIPVEEILRTYLDETEEDEIIEETEEIIERPKTEEELQAERKAEEEKREKEEQEKEDNKLATTSIQVDKSDSDFTSINEEEEKERLNSDEKSDEQSGGIKIMKSDSAVSASMAGELNNSITSGSPPTNPITIPTITKTDSSSDLEKESKSLTFNNIDSAIGVNKQVEQITAPKDIETLEEISELRNNQRNEEFEEEEDDSIKIHDSSVSLNGLDVEVLDKSSEKASAPLLTDIEVLT